MQSTKKANCRMWCIYSVPFWICGITYFVFPITTVIVFTLCCTAGIGWLIWYYKRIEKKIYKKIKIFLKNLKGYAFLNRIISERAKQTEEIIKIICGMPCR